MKILSVLLLLMVVFLGYDLWYGHNGYLDYREEIGRASCRERV